MLLNQCFLTFRVFTAKVSHGEGSGTGTGSCYVEEKPFPTISLLATIFFVFQLTEFIFVPYFTQLIKMC